MDKNKVEILQVAKRIMQLFGILPKNGRSATKWDRVALLLSIANYSVLTFFGLLHLVYNTSQRTISPDEVIEDVTVIFTTTGSLLIVSYVGFNNDKVYDFLEELRNFSAFSLPQNTYAVNRIINVATVIWCAIGMSATTTYYVYKLHFEGKCEINNKLFNRNDICGLIVPTWLPFTVSSNWIPLIRFVQINSFTPCLLLACATIIFLIGCSELIIVRIQHLKQLLQEAIIAKDFHTCDSRLRNCVKYHKHIIKLTEQFNNCFNSYYFLFLLQSSPLISIIGFNCIIEPKFTTFINFWGWLTGLSITCESGQRLIDESFSISQVIYATEWYGIDVSFQKTVKLMMLRTQRPLQQKAWIYANSSHVTFTKILKSSYSIIALLNTIYN